MRSGKNSDQLRAELQRNSHFRKRIRLACPVIGIETNVGRIAHLARGGNVAYHAFLSKLQAVPLAMQGATLHASKNQFGVGLVVKKNFGFHAAKRNGHIVYDLIYELIQIEDRGNFLRGLLQLEEILHLVNVQLA